MTLPFWQGSPKKKEKNISLPLEYWVGMQIQRMDRSFFDILLVGYVFMRKEHFDVTGRPATSNKHLGFFPLGQAPRSGSYCHRDDLYLCCKNQTFPWIQLVKWPCFKIILLKNPAKCPNLQYLDVKILFHGGSFLKKFPFNYRSYMVPCLFKRVFFLHCFIYL